MLNYTDWEFRNKTIYVKECEDYRFTIVIEPCAEGHEPRFYDKGMWEIYYKYNPKYYIDSTNTNVSVAMKFMDKFIEKYNKLMIFM